MVAKYKFTITTPAAVAQRRRLAENLPMSKENDDDRL